MYLDTTFYRYHLFFVFVTTLLLFTMLRKLFKRADTYKTGNLANHTAFVAVYNAVKLQWLEEQKAAQNYSAADQQQVTLNQKSALSQLIRQHNLEESVYMREFPLPILQDTSEDVELHPFERELDDIFP